MPGEAVEPLRASRALYDRLVKDHPENLDFRCGLGGSLNELGTARTESGPSWRGRSRHSRLRSSISSSRICATPQASTYTRFLANHYEGLAEAQVSLGQARAAIDSWARSRALREELVKTHPEVERNRLDQARTEQQFAISLSRLNRPADAIAPYTRARNLLEPMVQKHPEDVERRSMLGGVLNDLGLALAATGHAAEAMDAFEHAIEHQRFARERAPDVASTRDSSPIITLTEQCSSYSAGERQRRKSRSRRRPMLREAVVRAHPKVIEFQSDLIASLDSFGMFHVRGGNPSQALGFLDRARKLQQQLCESMPENPNLQIRLGGVLNDYGMALKGLGRHREAIEVFRGGGTTAERSVADARIGSIAALPGKPLLEPLRVLASA